MIAASLQSASKRRYSLTWPSPWTVGSRSAFRVLTPHQRWPHCTIPACSCSARPCASILSQRPSRPVSSRPVSRLTGPSARPALTEPAPAGATQCAAAGDVRQVLEGPAAQGALARRSRFGRSAHGARQLHEWARRRVAWHGVLRQFVWRLDLKRQAKHAAELSQPVVIVELAFAEQAQVPPFSKHVPGTQARSVSLPQTPAEEKTIVRFEMDKEQLKTMLGSIAAIQQSLQQYAGGR